VHKSSNAQLLRDADRFVGAGIIDQKNFINNAQREIGIGASQGRGRIVRGQDDHQFLAVNHERNRLRT
jgi:hypothetical protein